MGQQRREAKRVRAGAKRPAKPGRDTKPAAEPARGTKTAAKPAHNAKGVAEPRAPKPAVKPTRDTKGGAEPARDAKSATEPARGRKSAPGKSAPGKSALDRKSAPGTKSAPGKESALSKKSGVRPALVVDDPAGDRPSVERNDATPPGGVGAGRGAPRGSRPDGRAPRALRPVRITPGYIKHAEGSALIEMGLTRVICTASVEDSVPRFLRDTGRGWVTAEYGMLPRATNTRNEREAARGRIGGRTSEIQRLIGRVLRSVLDFERLGERTVRIDCDVLQADGGTRTAAITGGFVALAQAFDGLVRSAALRQNPIREPVAAVSVGIVGGRAVVDLDYAEDSQAEVDMNVAMTASGRFVEIQGTAEHAPFTQAQLDRMTALAAESMRELFAAQRAALAEVGATAPGTR